MPVPTTIADLSTSEASNSPPGSESIGTSADNYIRALAAILKNENARGSDITAATTITIPNNGKYFVVTGNTTIAGINNNWNGRAVWLVFSGTPQLTHSASLILPGAANLTMAAGDAVCIANESTGVWRVLAYQKAAGWQAAMPSASQAEMEAGTESALRSMSPLRVKQAIAALSSSVNTNGFRLTLTSGVPVTTSDVTSSSTLYCTPYVHNQISLYTGSAWVTRSSAQFSIALSGLTASRPYDVFCYDNAGTPTLELLAWTNDSTRATALAYQDGVLVKSGDATRRYLGSFFATGATATADRATSRFVWNYYNRVERPMSVVDATTSWTYTTATWRRANNSASNGVSAMIGVAEDVCRATAICLVSNSASNFATTGIGINSTSANSAQIRRGSANVAGGGVAMAFYEAVLPAGLNNIYWLERSQAAGTTTWYGAEISSDGSQSGMNVIVKG